MALANWTNKWVLMLITGIIIQAVVYPAVWFFQLFQHSFFFEVAMIGFISMAIQLIGFAVIMSKTRNQGTAVYAQGRPFRHKLREEDEELATRKPTAANS